MKAVLSFTAIIFMIMSLEGGAAQQCETCPAPLSTFYSKRKADINYLLAETGPSKSVITDALHSFASLLNPDDAATFSPVLTEIEAIVQNGDFTNETKLIKLGLKLDQIFVRFPAIEDAISYQIISEWGPLCDFRFIVDEMNIENFWKLSATRGTTTDCLLYDEILEAAKPIKFIKWKLYVKNIPCTKSWQMASHVVNLHHDIPEGRYREYLLTLELAGYDMTVNQVQRVARSYYSSKALTCRRLRDTFANYPSAGISGMQISTFYNLVGDANSAITPQSSTESCIQWYSGEMAFWTEGSPVYTKNFNKIYWNFPFGSFYQNIIYNDCQISVLKAHAPSYYN